MDYFDLFNKITLNKLKLTDISNLVVLKNDISDYLIPYTLKEGFSIFDAANDLYNDDKLYWIIYLTNPELFYDPLKSTEELNQILTDEYSVYVYQLKNLDYSYITSDYEWVHETSDGVEPIKGFDATRDLVITNSTKSGVIKLINGNISFTPEQKEYLYREAPKYYKLGDMLLNKLPTTLPYNSSTVEIITFEEDLQNKNEAKRIIKVLNPKYKDSLIASILENVNGQ